MDQAQENLSTTAHLAINDNSVTYYATFHDTVVETFLAEYQNAKNIEVPNGYSFKVINDTLPSSRLSYILVTN